MVVTSPGGDERDSREDSHREPGGLYRGSIAPVLACHCGGVLTSGNTPTARPLPRPPPAPSRGRAVCGDSPDTVPGERERISVRVIALTAERLSVPGSVSTGYHPRGGGARRGGGWNIPLPCRLRLWLNGIRRPPPPPGRYRGLLPPPPGGGQSVAIVRIPCQGRGKGFR